MDGEKWSIAWTDEIFMKISRLTKLDKVKKTYKKFIKRDNEWSQNSTIMNVSTV